MKTALSVDLLQTVWEEYRSLDSFEHDLIKLMDISLLNLQEHAVQMWPRPSTKDPPHAREYSLKIV